MRNLIQNPNYINIFIISIPLPNTEDDGINSWISDCLQLKVITLSLINGQH